MPKEELVLPPQYSRRILRISALTLASIISASYNGLALNTVLSSTVFFNSVNYWRYPVYGVRRNVDVVCACGSLGYQAIITAYATTPAARYTYWGAVGAGLCCYLMGRHAGRVLGNKNVSSMLHVGVHVFGNLGNLALYDSLGANHLGLGSS